MEIVIISALFAGAIIFLSRHIKKTFKEGESCQNCYTGKSECDGGKK